MQAVLFCSYTEARDDDDPLKALEQDDRITR